MCLIVDANVAAVVFGKDPGPDFTPVRKAIEEKRATAVYGGELANEYAKLGRVFRIIRELDRQGKMRHVIKDKVARETKTVKDEQLCRSDDPHIIALARVANVRLLCSQDTDLHKDFKNPRILNHPRGAVYQKASHAHLIEEHCNRK